MFGVLSLRTGAIVGLAILLATSGCFGQPKPFEAVVHETIRKGQFTDINATETRFEVITNETGWAEFWQRHTAKTYPPQSLPTVDFEFRWVAAVLLGSKPTAGFDVNITHVLARGDSYRVEYSVGEPCPDCHPSQGETRPYHIVEAERMGPGAPDVEFRRV